MSLLSIIILLIAIESGGKNDMVGTHGELGCLQIKRIVVDDINKNILHRNHFTYEDRLSRAKSVEMCQLYISYYATPTRLHHTPTIRDRVRIWKGGPTGYNDPETIEYWKRFQIESHR